MISCINPQHSQVPSSDQCTQAVPYLATLMQSGSVHLLPPPCARQSLVAPLDFLSQPCTDGAVAGGGMVGRSIRGLSQAVLPRRTTRTVTAIYSCMSGEHLYPHQIADLLLFMGLPLRTYLHTAHHRAIPALLRSHLALHHRRFAWERQR